MVADVGAKNEPEDHEPRRLFYGRHIREAHVKQEGRGSIVSVRCEHAAGHGDPLYRLCSGLE